MGHASRHYSDYKQSVRVASTGNINTASPGSTIDGVTMATGNRVLLKDQTTASQNGVYYWNGAASAMTRARDADQSIELTTGAEVTVEEGTANAATKWRLTTTGAITIGSTSLTFQKVTGTPVFAQRTISAATTLNATDYFVGLLTSTAAAGFTTTLPEDSANAGVTYELSDVENNAHNKNVTIAVQSGDKLNGTTDGTYVINVPGETVKVVSYGASGWFIV